MDHWTALLTAVAGVAGALVYIGRLIRRGVRLLDALGDIPEQHRKLTERTDANTTAIGELSNQVAWLRAALVGRRGR